MKKFTDLGVKMPEQNIFQVPVISVEDVLNMEIEVLDFEKNVKTRHGEGRYIVKIKVEEQEHKFFTNSTHLKQVLDQINKEDLPFLTTIKQQRYNGAKKSYQFT